MVTLQRDRPWLTSEERDEAEEIRETLDALREYQALHRQTQAAGGSDWRDGVSLAQPLTDYQREHIWHEARYVVIEATTKSGKTHGCIVWIYEQARAGQPGQHYWWIAPVYGQAAIAYERLRDALRPEVRKPNDSDLTLRLDNGTVIEFKSAEYPDRLYGQDVYATVMDEVTRCREKAFYAVRSTLTATRGPIRLIGNVKGRKNWAYRLARSAEAGEPDMHYARITASDAVAAGIIDATEVEDARRRLPASVFQELYEAEPSDDTGNPFGLQAIRACIAPLSEGEAVWWGWDLAKSVDWTVGAALDRSGAVCEFHRFQGDWFSTGLRIRSATGTAPALVDATGVGDPVVEGLQQFGGNFESFKFTATSKQQLMEGLAVAIQQREIRFPDGPIVAELEAFEYVYSRTGVHYSAPDGMHDDCVCALALAVQAKGKRGVPNLRFL